MQNRSRPVVVSAFRRLLQCSKAYWPYTLFGLVCIACNTLLILAQAWVLMQLMEAAVNRDAALGQSALLSAVIIFVASPVISFVRSYVVARAAEGTVRDLRVKLFAHTARLPISFFEANRTGDLMSRLTSDTETVKQAFGSSLLALIEHPITAVAAFVYLLTLNWKLALLCGSIGPLTVVAGAVFGPGLRENSRVVQETRADMNALAQDAMAGIHVVHAFGLEERLSKRYAIGNHQLLNQAIRGVRFRAGLSSAGELIGSAAFLFAFGFGGYLVVNGELEPATLLAFVQLLNRLTWPFSGLANTYGQFQTSLAAGERIFSVLDQDVEENSVKQHVALANDQEAPGIQFARVSFCYGDGEPVLSDLSLTVAPGETVALVGPSGAGKSTLLKLMMRFFTPTGGQLMVAGVDWNAIPLHEARRRMAFVSQDIYLFHGTVAENIAYGAEGHTTQAQIEAAARAANAEEFIARLPQGYETAIGERGVKLSGGQRQRLAIARALIRNAPILLLDEATSALDSESEAQVQEAMARLMQDRTVLVVAHRLSTVQSANRIAVIAHGRVSELGTHEELLAKGGLYSRLYKMQFRRPSEEAALGEANGLLGSAIGGS